MLSRNSARTDCSDRPIRDKQNYTLQNDAICTQLQDQFIHFKNRLHAHIHTTVQNTTTPQHITHLTLTQLLAMPTQQPTKSKPRQPNPATLYPHKVPTPTTTKANHSLIS